MDITLHYQESGQGQPLILLHGNGEDGSYFRHQIEYFRGRYRVIAIDTRGHGQSPRGAAPFTIGQFARDLSDFMSAHELPQAILLGFSDGANIAMKFALTYPGKVKALILNGGNLDPKGVKPMPQFFIELGYRLTKPFAARSPRAKRNAELLGLMVNDPNIAPEELSRITAPTLVICGSRDLIRQSHSQAIAEHIPNATLSVIPGDHFIAGKQHVPFNRAVEDFLRGVS